MKACTYCGAWIPDAARFCPACGAAGPPPGPTEGAKSRVRAVAILYLVSGLLRTLVALACGAWALTESESLEKSLGQGQNPAEGKVIAVLLGAAILLTLALGLLQAWSGRLLLAGRGRGLAVGIAAVWLVAGFMCCILEIPFGVGALVLLLWEGTDRVFVDQVAKKA